MTITTTDGPNVRVAVTNNNVTVSIRDGYPLPFATTEYEEVTITTDSTYTIPANKLLFKVLAYSTAGETDLVLELTVSGAEITPIPWSLTALTWAVLDANVVSDSDGTIVYINNVSGTLRLIFYTLKLPA